MKNWKLSKKITLGIAVMVLICMSLLYMTARSTLRGVMRETEHKQLESVQAAQTSLIEEYVTQQEQLLTAYSKTPIIRELLKDVNNTEKVKKAQAYTEYYYKGLDNWEGLYIGEWNSHCIVHSDSNVVGMIIRKGDSLKELQDAMTSRNGVYDAGIIVSPASKKLVLSMYCPVFDEDEKTILGYVGGGPYVEDLENILNELRNEEDTKGCYMVNVQTGTYILADDKTLIATEIQDDMLLGIMNQIKDGEKVGEYQYKSEK